LKKIAAPVAGLLVIDREIELFRLQIVTELIKMHITAGRKLSIAAANVTAAAAAAAAAESVAVTSSDMTLSSALPSSTSSSSSSSSSHSVPSSNGKSEEQVKTITRESQTSSTLDKKEGKKEGDKEKDKNKDKDKEGGNEKRGSMDVDTIEQHLDSSLQAVEAIAGTAVTSIHLSYVRIRFHLPALFFTSLHFRP
jgi:DNA mismatch repair ATPase MutL